MAGLSSLMQGPAVGLLPMAIRALQGSESAKEQKKKPKKKEADTVLGSLGGLARPFIDRVF